MSVLEVRGVGWVADGVTILTDVSFSVGRGEVVALLGSSGSGKTSILHACSGLTIPTSGAVRVEGECISALDERGRARFRAQRLGYVVQSFALIAELSPLENVVIAGVIGGMKKREAERRARGLLERLEIGDLMSRPLVGLAGGEQQRVAVARAMMNDPILLLADEPTGNLDSTTAAAVLPVLLEHRSDDEERAVLLVTHDLSIAVRADRVLYVRDGTIAGEMSIGSPTTRGEAGDALAGWAAQLASGAG